jgi:hypothetical protein
VARNGHARPRQVTAAADAVEVRSPRVNDRRADPVTGERARFRSSILPPPWCRKSPKVTQVLPLLYLHGLSSKDFIPALEEFLGSSAVAKITDDQEQLLAFFDFPAKHWVHLKTSNPIESTFSTVRLRTRVTKGPGSRAAGLAMVFKLIEAASERWRYVNGPHLVALVRAGAKFEKGVLIERPGLPRTGHIWATRCLDGETDI